MANQKWRFSKSRTRKRRSQYKIMTVKGVTCPNCGSPMIYHHVCPECGEVNWQLRKTNNNLLKFFNNEINAKSYHYWCSRCSS